MITVCVFKEYFLQSETIDEFRSITRVVFLQLMTSSPALAVAPTSSKWTTAAVITWPAPSAAASSAGSAWKRSLTCTTWGSLPTTHRQSFLFGVFAHLLCPAHQPFRLHVLGEETVEQEEEDLVAAGDSDRSSGRHHSHRWHRRSRHGHRDTGLRRPQGEPATISMFFVRFLGFFCRCEAFFFLWIRLPIHRDYKQDYEEQCSLKSCFLRIKES